MLAKVTRGNQVTIPKIIVKKAHLKEGDDYVDVEYVNGVICLKPVDVEEQITPEQYEKFLKWSLKREKGDASFSSLDQAIAHLKKRIKKS